MNSTTDYRQMVEKKFGKPLEEIMYDACVNKHMIPVEGAEYLGVPVNVFSNWRNYYRLGPVQRQVDAARDKRERQNQIYSEQLKDVDLIRPFQHIDQVSIGGLQEIIERYLELCKAKKIISEESSLGELSFIMEIGVLEKMLAYIKSYTNGRLHEQYMQDAEEHCNNRKE